MKLHALLLQHADALATLITLECGKPWEEAKGEVAYSASFIEWFAGEAKHGGGGDVIQAPRSDRRMLALKGPVGPAALLSVWNFPMAMLARKLAPALAAGCAVVARPDAVAPLSGLALAQLAQEAGFPPGVVNVVVGRDHAIAGALCADARIRKLSFTGSTRVGRLLMSASAGSLKRLSLELGGNAPFLVFADADVDAAVEGLMASKFRGAGQTCVCANRVFVHAAVFEEFKEKLLRRVATLVVGNGLASGVTIGPLISAAAAARVSGLVRGALEGGADLLAGGSAPRPGGAVTPGGHFFEPTVLDMRRADAAAAAGACPPCELGSAEVFGPVAPLHVFEDEDDALRRANSVDAGLAAYVYTSDLSRAWRVAERLDVGMLGINTGLISVSSAPFGGVKQSGFGREGGSAGLAEYQSLRYVMMST